MCLTRYYEDVTPADVAAILRHHARMEDIDVPALAAALAAEAAGEGAAPPARRSAAAPLSPEECVGDGPTRLPAGLVVFIAGASALASMVC